MKILKIWKSNEFKIAADYISIKLILLINSICLVNLKILLPIINGYIVIFTTNILINILVSY